MAMKYKLIRKQKHVGHFIEIQKDMQSLLSSTCQNTNPKLFAYFPQVLQKYLISPIFLFFSEYFRLSNV